MEKVSSRQTTPFIRGCVSMTHMAWREQYGKAGARRGRHDGGSGQTL
jgi:hypothetical protein